MCHCCFKFIAFLLLGIVVQGRLCIVHSTGAPIDVHCLECTLLYEMHERVEKLLYARVVTL